VDIAPNKTSSGSPKALRWDCAVTRSKMAWFLFEPVPVSARRNSPTKAITEKGEDIDATAFAQYAWVQTEE
jgi:hypothetical protein